jgi:acyl-CoA thioesterase-1
MQFVQRYIIVGIAFAIGLGVWYTRCAPPRAARATSGTAIIAFGDSLVAGRGASPGRDVASLLSNRLGVRIINAGRSGDTTASALARLDLDVLSKNPRVVLVVLGGNDVLRRVPRDQTFTNLASIVDRIRQRGAAVVLAGLSSGFLGDPYAGGYEDIARRHSAALVPHVLGDILGNAELMADTIHPNDRGYEVMADRLEPVLRSLIDD